MLEVDPRDLEIDDGTITVSGTATSVPIVDVATRIHLVRSSLPPGAETSALSVSSSYDAPCDVPDERGDGNFAANYTCSMTAAFVEADPVTETTILSWASAEDVGRVMHPRMLEGQVQGGIAQGIGYALGEDQVFDEAGTMINASMVDYQVPTAPMVPVLDKIAAIESLDPTHPLGNKGIGESGITPCAAAIVCASTTRSDRGDFVPPSPEKVARAISGAKTSSDTPIDPSHLGNGSASDYRR